MNETTNSNFDSTLSEPQKILGWHFSHDTKLGFKDNRPIVIGETLSVEGKIIPCEFGLHASEKAFDAFKYVHGKYLWRVELEEDLKSHANPNSNGITDKWVGRHRKVLAGGDATEMLLKFARDCALDAIHFWPNVPKEVKTFLETGVITELVINYFSNDTNGNSDYAVYNAAAACNAAYNAYNSCKNYDIDSVYDTIDYTTDALDIPFQTYTDKFEQACLDFISEKS